ncbi:uncharacterized protein [Leptinotarsa decemlineata]|uniref:uncharacterized protein n=1 Tax=Leptinotarsa decemlineata TaxID=7539 RepID=UPI000C251DA9|nr:uncharacterized protein LOC111503081 [Leptinotarsa decemlineata]
MSNAAPVTTRRVAMIVLSTIKKLGNSRGVTLKKIHDYIKEEYPNSPYNMMRLNNTLQKALAFGAVSKRNNRYVLGNIMRGMRGLNSSKGRKYSVIQARRRRRRGRKGGKKGRKGRSRKRSKRPSRRKSLRRRRR